MKRTINTLEDREKALKIIAHLYSEAEDLRDDADDKEAEAATWENAVEYFDNHKDESVLERLREHIEKTPGRFTWKEQLIIEKASRNDPLDSYENTRLRHLAFTELQTVNL
jgi:hypothetical protein